MYKNVFSLILIFALAACQSEKVNIIVRDQDKTDPFLLGIDNFLLNHLDLVKDKRVGLLTNPSGVNRTLKATSDLLYHHPHVNLTTLFAPEHGIRGEIYAGSDVKNTIDPKTSLPVFSLYGSHRKPTSEMLKKVDVIIIDIQDIGLRAYTYIYTMALIMTAAKESGKSVIILDRPNPIGGLEVEGNLVSENFFSFVGLYPIPYRHGMTIGELALLFNSEYNISCHLEVIPMRGWERKMIWSDTGLSWVPTSPHVPHWRTILHMIGSGTIGELDVLSVGVGYTSPFEIVGAPWIDGEGFARELNNLALPGVVFRPIHFKPYYGQYAGELCHGVQVHIKNIYTFKPYMAGLNIMQTCMRLYPEHDLFAKEDRIEMFDNVIGSDKVRIALTQHIAVNQIRESWQDSLNEFKQIRKKYLIYK